MSSNLLIGNAQPLLGSTLSLSSAADSSFPARNVIAGGRRSEFRSQLPHSSFTFQFTPPSALAVEFFFLARGNLLSEQTTGTVALQSSSDAVTWTNRLGTTAIQSASYFGPIAEDFISTSGVNDSYAVTLPTSAIAYWRINFALDSAIVIPLYSVMFGTWFDMGRDPSYPFSVRRELADTMGRRSSLVFDFEWKGVTYAKRDSFIAQFLAVKDTCPVILYTRTYHDVLHERRVMHARIASAEITNRAGGVADIRATFEELV